MYNYSPEFKVKIVKYYLYNQNTSLRKTALRFGVNYRSVFKWVKLYKGGGSETVFLKYRKAWNRKNKEIEQMIVNLKENEPRLTIREAKKILNNKGINVSIKGIWSIWRRYGYAGFQKNNMTNNFTNYCVWTEEAKAMYEKAERMFRQKKIKDAAEILNKISFLPENKLVQQIPDRFLALKRRIEKMGIMFGSISHRKYIIKLRELFETCISKNYLYSALRIGTMEVIALSWIPNPEEQLKKISLLEQLVNNSKNYYSYLLFEPYFTLNICKGITYAFTSRINESYKCAAICRKLLSNKKHQSAFFMSHLGYLYSNLQDYSKAEKLFLRAIDKLDNTKNRRLLGTLAFIYLYKGEYVKAIKLSKFVKHTNWGAARWDILFRASLLLMKGYPNEAILQINKVITLFKKENIIINLFKSIFIVAGAFISMGDRIKAKKLIRGLIPLLKKNKLDLEMKICKYLFISKKKLICIRSTNILPTLRLLFLLKSGAYYQALNFARKKGISDYFYKFCLFNNEIVKALVQKGKPTGLPKSLLQLPIFNDEKLVYKFNILGSLRVHKNQKYLKVRLRPKDSAFLIYLCTKAMEPKKAINLDEVYNNFWPGSESASRNFSHLLVRIKKALKVPTHLLNISRSYGEPELINEGIYFTTDYQEFEQTLARAKALERADEWGFARKEYLRAFNLFRGEPFKKNFDDWSVNMRFKILTQLETEAINFAKSCLEHNKEIRQKERRTPKNMADARKVLQKVLKIIPDSEEIQKLLDGLMVE